MTVSFTEEVFTGSVGAVTDVSEDVVAGAIGLSMCQAYNGPVRHRLPFH